MKYLQLQRDLSPTWWLMQICHVNQNVNIRRFNPEEGDMRDVVFDGTSKEFPFISSPQIWRAIWGIWFSVTYSVLRRIFAEGNNPKGPWKVRNGALGGYWLIQVALEIEKLAADFKWRMPKAGFQIVEEQVWTSSNVSDFCKVSVIRRGMSIQVLRQISLILLYDDPL